MIHEYYHSWPFLFTNEHCSRTLLFANIIHGHYYSQNNILPINNIIHISQTTFNLFMNINIHELYFSWTLIFMNLTCYLNINIREPYLTWTILLRSTHTLTSVTPTAVGLTFPASCLQMLIMNWCGRTKISISAPSAHFTASAIATCQKTTTQIYLKSKVYLSLDNLY